MNSKELTKALAVRLKISQAKATTLLNGLTQTMRDEFGKQSTVAISKIGIFKVRKIESHKAYSPVKKEYVLIPPKRILDFHASETLKEKIKNIGKG